MPTCLKTKIDNIFILLFYGKIRKNQMKECKSCELKPRSPEQNIEKIQRKKRKLSEKTLPLIEYNQSKQGYGVIKCFSPLQYD